MPLSSARRARPPCAIIPVVDDAPLTVLIPFTVAANYAGWRLDLFLLEKIGRISRVRAQALIRESLVYAPDAGRPRALKASTPVWSGLTFHLRRRASAESAEPPPAPRVVFRDDALLVVEKPAGLALHPTASARAQTLTTALRVHFGAPGVKPDPAHRLDRETSGLVACGLAPRFTAKLKAQFAARTIAKRYLALVEGDPPCDALELDGPLKLGDGRVMVKMAVREDGMPSRTRVRVVERRRDAAGRLLALVEAEPLTGRQHQIRAHLAHAGFPIVGDKLYGPSEEIFLRLAESRRQPAPPGTFDALVTDTERAALRLTRQALHAAFLALDHPVTGERMSLSSPLPEDLRAFWDSLTSALPAG